MRVILARRRHPAAADGAPPAVHAYRVPDDPTSAPTWQAVCGDELAADEAEQVPQFTGAPCPVCLLTALADQPSTERARSVGTYPTLQPVSPTGRWAVALWGERHTHLVAPDAPRAKLDGHDVVHAACGHLAWGPLDTPPTDWPLCPECQHIRGH